MAAKKKVTPADKMEELFQHGSGWTPIHAKFSVRSFEEGMAVVEMNFFDKEAHIGAISVPPENRRRGIAHKVLSELTAEADKAGATLTLTVDPLNDKPMNRRQLAKLYKQHGFNRKPYALQPEKLSWGMVREPAQSGPVKVKASRNRKAHTRAKPKKRK